MVELVLPSQKYMDSYIDALEEGFAPGIQTPRTPEEIEEIKSDFETHIKSMNPKEWKGKTITGPDGGEHPRVAESTFWLIESGQFIGLVNLRHTLSEFLKTYGGHIGYGIRPSMRQKGFGKEILRLVLGEAAKLGLEKVLVTCDPNNVGSRKIIEANGGRLEKTLQHDWSDVPTNLYWIDVKTVKPKPFVSARPKP